MHLSPTWPGVTAFFRPGHGAAISFAVATKTSMLRLTKQWRGLRYWESSGHAKRKEEAVGLSVEAIETVLGFFAPFLCRGGDGLDTMFTKEGTGSDWSKVVWSAFLFTPIEFVLMILTKAGATVMHSLSDGVFAAVPCLEQLAVKTSFPLDWGLFCDAEVSISASSPVEEIELLQDAGCMLGGT